MEDGDEGGVERGRKRRVGERNDGKVIVGEEENKEKNGAERLEKKDADREEQNKNV